MSDIIITDKRKEIQRRIKERADKNRMEEKKQKVKKLLNKEKYKKKKGFRLPDFTMIMGVICLLLGIYL